jgi:hypothetical protein
VEVQDQFEEWLDDEVRKAETQFTKDPPEMWLDNTQKAIPDCPSGVVHAVPRLEHELAAMLTFLQPPKPVMIVLRPVRGHLALVYGFVDASGEGLGG